MYIRGERLHEAVTFSCFREEIARDDPRYEDYHNRAMMAKSVSAPELLRPSAKSQLGKTFDSTIPVVSPDCIIDWQLF